MVINTKIVLSSASILASLAIISVATFAYFSNQGTSNDNVFAAGTLDLKLSDNTPETDQDNVTASFGGTNLAPGASVSGQLRLKNTGSIAASHAEVALVNTNSDITNPLDKVLELTTLDYGGVSVLSQVINNNGNGWTDLDDLKSSGLDNLALTDLNTNHNLDLTVTFRSDAGNEYQGDSVDSDWTVTLNQDASQ
ncbi:MAG: hypothetical protein UU73_C0002G0066 [Candidatus Daviesbacteria bacterium GW2011_GWA1_41_61]|uniref:Uncharacterized protein n=1 Tax=Candidatus Daviesbacteria bacterium GW2011_GWA2_40_9 TaxID=1618424 RepID=A0A0G0U133_9BACT|nr:MAG: seg [Candidatus Daviesbacteria bacterium GW2011_GWC1_40_9]KKR82813.1 MAG: hypothetical protein UU29_C0009G0084 [Candidatus Daviesbacteria bacterium GW2011_GWA2_40_9]KKR93726.1 MAG: hypothetical protein UU44_C0001G0066 [Candidatus Daviesbacteria bacterium GW2011_GWB1_41_15]KKS15192.1 MAG: hypothetical protein UU73_C0002G0066 [Candidatus Daviesbacteria bacterium GW2011_GWA1_41_61]